MAAGDSVNPNFMKSLIHKKWVFSQPIGKQINVSFLIILLYIQDEVKKNLCQFLSTKPVTLPHCTLFGIPLIMVGTAKSMSGKYSRSAGIHLL